MTAAMHAVLFVIVVRLLYGVREGFQKLSMSVNAALTEYNRATNARDQIVNEVKQIKHDYGQTKASLDSARSTYENRKNEYEQSRNQYEEIKSEVGRSEEKLKDLGVSLGMTEKRLIDAETRVKDTEMNLQKAREEDAAADTPGVPGTAKPEPSVRIPAAPPGKPSLIPRKMGDYCNKGTQCELNTRCLSLTPSISTALKSAVCVPWVHNDALPGLPPGATGQRCGGKSESGRSMPGCIKGGTCKYGICFSN